MNKFVIPLAVVLVAGAFVIGFFLGKGIQTADQSASIIRGVPSKMIASPGTPDANFSYVWANGVCWSTAGGPNGDVWSPTPYTLSGCPAISSNNSDLVWARMTTITTASVPQIKTSTGATVPAGYIWKDGVCYSVKGGPNGNVLSPTPYTLSGCPALKASTANVKN